MHENFATAFDQLWKILLDEENWISLKWSRLACEARHTIGNEEFRFTSPIDQQEDVTWLWMARGMFRLEYRGVRPDGTQRGPYGLAAPSSMNDVPTERQHLR